MAQVIALVAATPLRFSQIDALRTLIICSCALALIAAGQGVPA